jgi:hypothetical protein
MFGWLHVVVTVTTPQAMTVKGNDPLAFGPSSVGVVNE